MKKVQMMEASYRKEALKTANNVVVVHFNKSASKGISFWKVDIESMSIAVYIASSQANDEVLFS